MRKLIVLSFITLDGVVQGDGGPEEDPEGDAVQLTDDDVLERLCEAWATKWDGRWQFEARNSGFHHKSGGMALVFSVTPTKILAFAKGNFSHTRHQF